MEDKSLREKELKKIKSEYNCSYKEAVALYDERENFVQDYIDFRKNMGH